MEKFNADQVKQLREIVSDIMLPLHQNLTARIDTIDARMERGFTALSEDTADARAETVAFRDEFAEFRTETHENFASLRTELRDIRHRLEALEEVARNSAGLTKEIDHIMERVRAIEKHLGIQHKVAA